MATPEVPSGSSPGSSSGSSLEPNLAAALSYTWIGAIVFLAMEPFNRDRFVRFHSFQALVLFPIWCIGSVIITIVFGILPFIGWLLTSLFTALLGLAGLALWIVCIIKAYQKQWFKLPVIGDWAEKQAGKA